MVWSLRDIPEHLQSQYMGVGLAGWGGYVAG